MASQCSPIERSRAFPGGGMAIPTVTSVTPNQGPSSGGTTVNVVGSNFIAANKVAFGDASASFTVNSPSSLTAFSPPHVPGTVDLRVTNPDGTSAPHSAPSPPDRYTYHPIAPTVTSVSTTNGPAAGGTTVTILGHGFLTATAVNFGSPPGPGPGTSAAFVVLSANQITAFTPPH